MKNLRKKRRETEHEEENLEGTWAVSYGDMITLLLGFFVIFFSIEPPKKQKDKLTDSLVKALEDKGMTAVAHNGGTAGQGKVETEKSAVSVTEVGASAQQDANPSTVQKPSKTSSPKTKPFPLQQALEKQWSHVTEFFIKIHEKQEIALKAEGELPQSKATASHVQIADPDVVAKRFGDQIVIRFPKVSFFDSAQTDLTAPGKNALAKFVEIYRPFAGKTMVSIIGYTDSRPVTKKMRFRDNLELSVLRSVSVQRELEKGGIPLAQTRLSGHGVWGEKLEIAPQSAEDQLALARTVVLVVEPLEE